MTTVDQNSELSNAQAAKAAEAEARKSSSKTMQDIDIRKGTKLTAPKRLDYGDLKEVWGKMLDTQRPDAEAELLRISSRLTKLDPLAELALAKVKKKFTYSAASIRRLIVSKGIATELDRVQKRLNGLRLSDNKRLVLSAVYPALLANLLDDDNVDEEIKDEKGFADAVLFELERKNGPLDTFAQELVKLVATKNRINLADDNVLGELIAHQVRVNL
jgi:hypothetical protein